MPQEERQPVRVGAVTIAELSAGLVWPLLLRSVGLAVQGSRLVVGLITVLGVIAAVNLFVAVGGPLTPDPADAERADYSDAPPALEPSGAPGNVGSALGHVIDRTLGPDGEFTRRPAGDTPAGAALSLYSRTVGAGTEALRSRPWATLLLLLILIPVWSVGGAAISRSAALDVAGDLNLSARESLLFGLSRVWITSLALAAPLMLIVLIGLGLRLLGWLLLSLGGVDVLGALLYGLFLAIGFIAVLVFAGFLVGHAMLAPAVAADGCDPIDAVGRAYAYVLAKPGRLLLYALILLVQAAIALAVAGWLVELAVAFTADGAGGWLGEGRRIRLFAVPGEGAPVAARIIAFWNAVARLMLGAFAVSLYFCSATALYMVMRRVCDEQDVREVWIEPAPPAGA